MTEASLSLALRQQTVIRLRAVPDLTGITDRLFGEVAQSEDGSPPERPFGRFGVDEELPKRSSCWGRGRTIEFPWHSFSKEKFTDEVRRMNDIVERELDGAVLDLGGGIRATLEWLSSTVLRDAGDPGAWHGIARFRATI